MTAAAAAAAAAGTQAAGPRSETLSRRRVYILPTRQGMGLAGVLAVMLIGAANYDNGLGYALTFVIGSLWLVSILHTYRNLAGLTVRGAPAAPVFAGAQASFEVVLDNHIGPERHAVAVRFASRPDVALPGDRAVLAEVAPGAAKRVALNVTARKRGWLPLGPVTVASRYPLGLFRAWSTVALAQRCLVYPRPGGEAPLPEAEADRHRHGTSHAPGRDDFAGLREYHPGDSPRHIHWKAVAREQGVPVKLFSGTGAATVDLSFDAAGPGDTEARLSQLARWVLTAEAEGQRYALQLPGARLAADTGTAHRNECLRLLALHGQPEAQPR